MGYNEIVAESARVHLEYIHKLAAGAMDPCKGRGTSSGSTGGHLTGGLSLPERSLGKDGLGPENACLLDEATVMRR